MWTKHGEMGETPNHWTERDTRSRHGEVYLIGLNMEIGGTIWSVSWSADSRYRLVGNLGLRTTRWSASSWVQRPVYLFLESVYLSNEREDFNVLLLNHLGRRNISHNACTVAYFLPNLLLRWTWFRKILSTTTKSPFLAIKLSQNRKQCNRYYFCFLGINKTSAVVLNNNKE